MIDIYAIIFAGLACWLMAVTIFEVILYKMLVSIIDAWIKAEDDARQPLD